MIDYTKYDDVKMVIKTHPDGDIVIPVEKFIRVDFVKGDITYEYVIPERLIKYLLLERLDTKFK